VDFRSIERLQFDILSRELSGRLPGYQLVDSQIDVESLLSLRRSFRLLIDGFVKLADVQPFISSLRSLWNTTLPGNVTFRTSSDMSIPVLRLL